MINENWNEKKNMKNDPCFSIIVVCYQAGKELSETVKSIASQTCGDYEVLVKDGMSTDGSVEELLSYLEIEKELAEKVQVIRQKDAGIYDAMNQAIQLMSGRYVLFLNCGDYFADEEVLYKTKQQITNWESSSKQTPAIFYGNRFNRISGSIEYAAPEITPFVCFRNIPCHQTCFYAASLFADRGYDTGYRVRADYEHFLWSYFVKKTALIAMPFTVASYEGGGFSETAENEKCSAKEHKEITGKYMTLTQLFLFRAYLLITLAPLRHILASSPKWSARYNRLVKTLYRRGGTK
ncbi:MAG: glycosyltransferase [Lachnospiraceae bacterium]|nr:glycosyltransferase [Lachnospiraceae bacterium]